LRLAHCERIIAAAETDARFKKTMLYVGVPSVVLVLASVAVGAVVYFVRKPASRVDAGQ
jgi:hypothetical protein